MNDIDAQAHADVVELIEKEYGVMGGSKAERVASLIEARLSATKKSRKWHPCQDGEGGYWFVATEDGRDLVCYGQLSEANARLIAAAPDLAEAALAVAKLYLSIKGKVLREYPEAGMSKHIYGEHQEYELLLEALREAGADI